MGGVSECKNPTVIFNHVDYKSNYYVEYYSIPFFENICTYFNDFIYVISINLFFIPDDATPPDIDYLWENYDTQIVCRRARGSVCAKYSYSFNNERKFLINPYLDNEHLFS